MSRLKKLKIENIKNANELLEKGHATQYPSQEPVVLKPSGNVTKASKSFINKMNNLNEADEFQKRQDRLTPGKNPEEFYGDGSLDRLRNMGVEKV